MPGSAERRRPVAISTYNGRALDHSKMQEEWMILLAALRGNLAARICLLPQMSAEAVSCEIGAWERLFWLATNAGNWDKIMEARDGGLDLEIRHAEQGFD